MPLTLNCPKCKTPFKVRDDALGQKVKCPNCAAVLAVPANIGPASITDIPIDPNVGKQSSPYGAAPPPVPPRPLHESRPVSALNDDDPETLGLEQNEDLGKRLASPSMKNIGSRSRAEATRAMPDPVPVGPPTGARPRPVMPAPVPVAKKNQPVPVGEDGEVFRGWRSVAGGLRLIQVGTWFTFLALLGYGGLLAYYHFGKVNRLESNGFLKIGSLWQEIELLVWFIPTLLGAFLILLGRSKLRGAPLSSEARGIATGSLLFTLLVFVGVAGFTAYTFLVLTRTINDSPDLAGMVSVGLAVTAVFFVISELWYLLYLSQVGNPVGEPKMTSRVATFLLTLFFFAAIPIVVSIYYPLFGNATGGRVTPFRDAEDRALNVLYSYAGTVVLVFLTYFLYTRLAGKVRQAIRRLIQDREPMMVMSR